MVSPTAREDLVSTALLGTDRRNPPPPPPDLADLLPQHENEPATVLDMAALDVIARRAGATLRPHDGPRLDPAPADQRPQPPDPATTRLRTLLRTQPGGGHP